MATEKANTNTALHEWFAWGECWQGTKEQLQAVGIGAGVAFPGEPGGPPRSMTVRDRRGYRVVVNAGYRWEGTGQFHARSPYRDDRLQQARKRRRQRTTDFAPGVNRYCDDYYADHYTGTAEDLTAAGLIRRDQLPGQPGRGKMRVSYHADGTQARCGSGGAHRLPGYTVVTRQSATRYTVEVHVSQEEQVRRKVELERLEADDEIADAAARRLREHRDAGATVQRLLRLVASNGRRM